MWPVRTHSPFTKTSQPTKAAPPASPVTFTGVVLAIDTDRVLIFKVAPGVAHGRENDIDAGVERVMLRQNSLQGGFGRGRNRQSRLGHGEGLVPTGDVGVGVQHGLARRGVHGVEGHGLEPVGDGEVLSVHRFLASCGSDVRGVGSTGAAEVGVGLGAQGAGPRVEAAVEAPSLGAEVRFSKLTARLLMSDKVMSNVGLWCQLSTRMGQLTFDVGGGRFGSENS